MNRSRRDSAIAALLTLIIYAGAFVLCLFACLEFPPGGEPLPQPKPEDDAILLGGEYVMLGDDPSLALNSLDEAAPDKTEADASTEADDLENAGEIAEPAPVVTSKQESPMKVQEKPKPEKTGPTKEEIAAREKAKREKEASDKIKKQMTFSGKGSGKGKAGSPNGNSTVGAPSGSPGHNLAGRTIESFDKPSAQLSGEIRVRVKVNAKGQVVSAAYEGGSGPAAGNAAVRSRCVDASRRSRFSVRTDSDSDQSGVITWRFK